MATGPSFPHRGRFAFRFAANVFIGSTIVWAVLSRFEGVSPIWAIAAMIASADPQVDVARRMIRSRLINVFVGAVVGLAFLLAPGSTPWKLPFALAVTVLISSYVLRITTMWRQAPITAALVIATGLARQSTDSPTFENVWAYESNPRTAQPQVCNGDEVDTAPPVAIAASPTGATASGTTATFTTTVPHRLSVGSAVSVAGVGVAAYNGNWTVLTVPSSTTFTATIGTSGPAASGGGTANGDQDDILATRWSTTCHAEHGANDVFDLSGNAKEWVQARAAGQNPLRGGSANNAVNGLTCKINFTLADDTFFFPNVGFRCCR